MQASTDQVSILSCCYRTSSSSSLALQLCCYQMEMPTGSPQLTRRWACWNK